MSLTHEEKTAHRSLRRRTAVEHRFLPETYKAARHATKARPRSH
ncbi:hypothetical protein GCM10010145_47560 [Streptomyces ruber]|uniref:Uncharacterized protein n=2 Tax=Streptomyces TaxID=1883 RepID=A0A918EV24_9ACTN|nr:hypothetical protein [Streptomyces ruber]GGQ72441.1 hypothetical protein GCM10010145_47560 [Streptomyces ruber]